MSLRPRWETDLQCENCPALDSYKNGKPASEIALEAVMSAVLCTSCAAEADCDAHENWGIRAITCRAYLKKEEQDK